MKIFELKIYHHFVELNELILKMHTVLWFKVVFHKIIEENWKNFCVEISYSFFCVFFFTIFSVNFSFIFLFNIFFLYFFSIFF